MDFQALPAEPLKTGHAASVIRPGSNHAQTMLIHVTLSTVSSPHSRRNYATALHSLFAFAGPRPLTRALLMDYRASMEGLSPSTINVRLSAVRKMVHEARKNGMIGSEEAANLVEVPNVTQRGTRSGNWLTRDQARKLLSVPDRETLKGKRDYLILAMLLGCALRRHELTTLDVDTLQMREGRWVLADLVGKGRRLRTVAVPAWVKHAVDEWLIASEIRNGLLLRAVGKSGRMKGSMSDWAVWSIVEHCAKQIGVEHFGAHDLRRTCARLCRKAGGDLEQIKFLLGHSSIQTTERYLGSGQELAVAVNDRMGL